MKALLASSIMLAALLIPFFAVLMYRCWGWIGMTLYLVYAALCFSPSVAEAYRIKKGGAQ